MENKFTFQCISDTHERHEQIQLDYSDAIIFAGDNNCRWEWQLAEFFQWFSEQPCKYKIYVPGNHDRYCELYPEESKQLAEDHDIIMLVNEEVVIEGHKFYGSPFTPMFYNWAFMEERGKDMEKIWSLIPDDTDVLITHGPPYSVLDECPGGHVGCEDLLKRVLEVKPKYHVFGHIHESAGEEVFEEITFLNAAVLNGFYHINNLGIRKGEL